MKSHDRAHDGRGRHRHRNSAEQKRWRELERNLDSVLHLKPPQPPKRKPLGPAPMRPSWLADDETWAQLLEMRKGLA